MYITYTYTQSHQSAATPNRSWVRARAFHISGASEKERPFIASLAETPPDSAVTATPKSERRICSSFGGVFVCGRGGLVVGTRYYKYTYIHADVDTYMNYIYMNTHLVVPRQQDVAQGQVAVDDLHLVQRPQALRDLGKPLFVRVYMWVCGGW
jgi:hypothetical protein